MVTIFNRKFLYSTYSIKEMETCRTLLMRAGIEYYRIAQNRDSGVFKMPTSRSRGTFGINHDFDYLYKIYVKKTDHENASFHIRSIHLPTS